MLNTRINYDMLTYLPKDLDTVKGQDILLNDFGKGAFSLVLVENKTPEEVADLKNKIEGVDHVDSVLWYNTLLNTDVPMTILPNKYYDEFNKDGGTLMAVFFDSSTSADETIKAIGDIRALSDNDVYITGMDYALHINVGCESMYCINVTPMYTMVSMSRVRLWGKMLKPLRNRICIP